MSNSLYAFFTSNKVLATKHLGQGHEKLEKCTKPQLHLAQNRDQWEAAFCPDLVGASYQLGTSPCVIPTHAKCQQTGQAHRSEAEAAGPPFPHWTPLEGVAREPLDLSTRNTQKKSNPSGQENSFKRKRKKSKRCNTIQENFLHWL